MSSDNPLGLTPFDAAEYLTDEETIAEFLNAAAEIGEPQVLLDAFAAVARAHGMSDLAKKAGLGRESLYKALSPGAHPRYETIYRVAHALGVGLSFTVPSRSGSNDAVGKKSKPHKAVAGAKPRPRRHQEERAVAKESKSKKQAGARDLSK